jgi:hypothetical protein
MVSAWVSKYENEEHIGKSYPVGPLKSSANSNIPMLPKG